MGGGGNEATFASTTPTKAEHRGIPGWSSQAARVSAHTLSQHCYSSSNGSTNEPNVLPNQNQNFRQTAQQRRRASFTSGCWSETRVPGIPLMVRFPSISFSSLLRGEAGAEAAIPTHTSLFRYYGSSNLATSLPRCSGSIFNRYMKVYECISRRPNNCHRVARAQPAKVAASKRSQPPTQRRMRTFVVVAAAGLGLPSAAGFVAPNAGVVKVSHPPAAHHDFC